MTGTSPGEDLATAGLDVMAAIQNHNDPEVALMAHLWVMLRRAEEVATQRRIVNWLSARLNDPGVLE